MSLVALKEMTFGTFVIPNEQKLDSIISLTTLVIHKQINEKHLKGCFFFYVIVLSILFLKLVLKIITKVTD